MGIVFFWCLFDCLKNRRKKKMEKMKRLFKEEKGQGMTEYGLILGLIALAAVLAMGFFGDAISDKFDVLTATLTDAGN
jgi:pilus assembly protein Flp/PilA